MPKNLTTPKHLFTLYFRNFIFGVEDSLVSTVGLLSGVAIADVPTSTIFLSGIVLIFVEAFSMGAGSFLSEQSAEGYKTRKQATSITIILGGVIMFFSYFLAGFIPLSPYLFLSVEIAFWVSIIVSLFALFSLGVIAARLSKISIWKSALRMFLIGGTAIALGVLVGRIVSEL